MVIKIRLSVADLAATRFATSALGETIAGVRLLDAAEPATVNRPWLKWARQEWAERELTGAPVQAGLLWPLVNNGLACFPEFIMPAPRVRWPDFEDELDMLAATPAAAVRGRAAGVPRQADRAALGPDQACARRGYRLPVSVAGKRRGTAAVRRHAPGSALVTGRHADHAGHRVRAGRTRTRRAGADAGRAELVARVGEAATSTQTTLIYPARGAATVWQEVPGRAGQDAITPGAVSQHLTVLHRAGLLRRERSGRAVLYQVSDLGLALLNGRVALHADLSRRGQRADRRAAGAAAG